MVKSTDGTNIAWYDFGGNGPDILLAHATGFCGQIWLPVVEHLRDSFRCVTYDLRGHGQSASPTSGRSGWDWWQYAEDAWAVINAASLTNPFGAGHSCGGATELLVEEKHPGTFASLYLFEPVVFTEEPPAGPDPERDLAQRTLRRRVSFTSRADARAQFASRGPFASLDPAALDAYTNYGFVEQPDGSVTLRCTPEDEAEVYIMASAHDGFSHLQDVKCRTVIAHGSQSRSFTKDHMMAVQARLSDSSFEEWEGLGHFGPLEQPRAFARALISTFLRPNS